MEARELKFFIRYLKERGLYSAFVKDARRQQDERLYGIPFQKFIRGLSDSTEILMHVVNWGASEYRYWQNVYDDYKSYFREKYYKR
jgi:hypothetical protein